MARAPRFAGCFPALGFGFMLIEIGLEIHRLMFVQFSKWVRVTSWQKAE
jgi:hypothetical protein